MKISKEKVREAVKFVRTHGETTIANYAQAQSISEAYASTILKTTHERGLIGLVKPEKSFGPRSPYLYTSVTAGVEKDPESDDPYTPVVPVTATRSARKRPVRGAKQKVVDFLAEKQIGYRFDVVRVQKACKISHQPVREALKPYLESGLVTKDGFKAGRQQYKKVGNFGAAVTTPAVALAAVASTTPVADLSFEQVVAENREIDARVEALLERRSEIKARMAEYRALVNA